MLQWLYTYVAKVYYQFFPDACCKCGCCICFTHKLHVFYLDVLCLQCFLSVSRCSFQVFQKYVLRVLRAFRRMLQLLHLNVSKGDGLLCLLTFYYIVLVCPSPGAGKASIRRCGEVLPNQRRYPLPLLLLEQRGPRVKRAKRRTPGRWHYGFPFRVVTHRACKPCCR
jgi:hypothetical protein